ncbi:MAG TPA: glycosyl transferase, partial [Lentzea sp.]|nr:glycosyl transferase [Lentzea sp.]
HEPVAAAVLSGSVALSALQCYLLVEGFSTPVAVLVLMAGLIAAVGLVLSLRWAIPVALVAALLGPTTYSFATVTTPHTGAIPVAGPSARRMGGGGLLDTTTPDAEVVTLLQDNAGRYRWAAATIGSNNAAGLQLASGLPVMAMGGFNGTDPAPTLEQFQEMVRSGQIHYYVAAGRMMQGETGSDTAHQIADWVAANYTATTVSGTTLYPLDAS